MLSKKSEQAFASASVGQSSHFTNQQKNREKRAAGHKAKGASVGGNIGLGDGMFLLPTTSNKAPGKS